MLRTQLFFLRLAIVAGAIGLPLKMAAVVLADTPTPAVTPTVSTASSGTGTTGAPFDVWQLLMPIQNLGEMAIRVMAGAVGIAFAVGTQKNAFVANITHQVGMANQAAGAIFQIGIGVVFFIGFWVAPGVIKYIYQAVITPDMVNNMSNLNWLHNVGGQ